MGTFSTLTTTFEDTAFNTGNNAISIGSVGAGYTITGVDVIGSFNFEVFEAVTAGDHFVSYVQAGIQHGPSGYTPVGTGGDPDAPNWLLHQHIRPSASIAFGPTNTGTYIQDRYAFALRWRGQLPLGATAQDFYFSTASQYGSSAVGWFLTMAARLYFA